MITPKPLIRSSKVGIEIHILGLVTKEIWPCPKQTYTSICQHLPKNAITSPMTSSELIVLFLGSISNASRLFEVPRWIRWCRRRHTQRRPRQSAFVGLYNGVANGRSAKATLEEQAIVCSYQFSMKRYHFASGRWARDFSAMGRNFHLSNRQPGVSRPAFVFATADQRLASSEVMPALPFSRSKR